MQWDLGIQGLGLLTVMALAFGVIAQATVGRVTTPWLWLIGSVTFFVAGLITSEVWFGWATAEELQPNIDGLSFDEVLLGGILAGGLAVLVTWFMTRRSGRGHPMTT